MLENSAHAHSGIFAGDVALLDRALSGIVYPADKWQLIDYAQRDLSGQAKPHQRAIWLLWALPTGSYRGLAQVLACAARTTRGHPRRDNPASMTS